MPLKERACSETGHSTCRSLAAHVRQWSRRDFCDYLLYLTWVCGVPVHQRYAVALLAHTAAGQELTQTSPLMEKRANATVAELTDTEKATLRAVVQRSLFPDVLARAAALQAKEAALLQRARGPSPTTTSCAVSVLVGLAVCESAESDGSSTSRVVEAAESSSLAAEALALRKAGPADDWWASAAFAAAVGEAAAIEGQFGWGGGTGCRLVPATRRPPDRSGEVGARKKARLESGGASGPVIVDADEATGEDAVAAVKPLMATQTSMERPPASSTGSSPPAAQRSLGEFFQARASPPASLKGRRPGRGAPKATPCAIREEEVVVISDTDEE